MRGDDTVTTVQNIQERNPVPDDFELARTPGNAPHRQVVSLKKKYKETANKLCRSGVGTSTKIWRCGTIGGGSSPYIDY